MSRSIDKQASLFVLISGLPDICLPAIATDFTCVGVTTSYSASDANKKLRDFLKSQGQSGCP